MPYSDHFIPNEMTFNRSDLSSLRRVRKLLSPRTSPDLHDMISSDNPDPDDLDHIWKVSKFTKLVVGVWIYTGFIVSLILFIPVFYMVASGSWNTNIDSMPLLMSSINALSFEQLLLIPGITRPFYEVIYLFMAVILSLVVHELGHALAAKYFDIPIIRISWGMILGFLPIAFVEIDERILLRKSRTSRLAVITAGIWHNICMCIGLMLAWYVSGYVFFWIRQNDGMGATIVSVPKSSRLVSSPIQVGDVLDRIDAYDVTSSLSLFELLKALEALGSSVPFNSQNIDQNVVITPVRWDDSHRFKVSFMGNSPEKYQMIRHWFSKVQVCDYHLSATLLDVFRYLPFGEALIRILLKLPIECNLIMKYLFSISCSCAIFNLLPIPRCDGEQLIQELIGSSKMKSRHHHLHAMITFSLALCIYCFVNFF